MVRQDPLTVATDERGATVLGGLDGVETAPLGAQNAEVIWRRHGMTGIAIAEALPLTPYLRWLHTDTAGVDDLPLIELAARGVLVTRTSAYTEAVAEWIVAAVLIAAKGAHAYLRASDAREWAPAAGRPRLVAGSQALVIGNGEIGSYAGAMLRGMGVRVHLASRRSGDWRTLLPTTDWLILACPLTEETRRLVGDAELEDLKPGGWVVNVARGGVLDEAALAKMLDSGKRSGAVLDTFEVEPLPVCSPLWDRGNVIVLPHDTWRAFGAGQRQAQCFLGQMHRYRNGQPLNLMVDAAAGY